MSSFQKIFSNLYRNGKYARRDVAALLHLNDGFFKNARGNRIILYHGICKKSPTRFNTLFLTQKTFEAHLLFYKKYFQVVSLDEYYQRQFNADRFNICLTFDDGFANNYDYVLPLLEQYQIPATFFITAISKTGLPYLWNDFLAIAGTYGPKQFTFRNETFVRNRFHKYASVKTGKILQERLRSEGFEIKQELVAALSPYIPFQHFKRTEEYWLQMTPEQIEAAAASPLITVGSHSYFHNDLAKIFIEEARTEMRFSKEYLEEITGKEIRALAFPYGSYSDSVLAEAKKAGYTQLLTTEYNSSKDQYDTGLKERFGVNPFISGYNQMYANITGHYE